MKEIREEAEKHRKAKLERYGADHKACGGSMKRYAHGGEVHPHKEHDKHLARKIEHEAKEIEHDHKKYGGHVKHHRDMGGPVAGGKGPRLGRNRHGGKGKTSVNIAIGKPSGDGPAPMPPALGAGPGPGMPSAPPPRPMPPPGPAAMPPRPGMPPMKRGGKIEHKKHHEHGHKAEHHHREHRKQHH